MKKIVFLTFLISIIIIFIGNNEIVFADDAELTEACAKYKNDSKDQDFIDYCWSLGACEVYSPTKNQTNVLRVKTIPFVPISQASDSVSFSLDANGDLYNNFLWKIMKSWVPFIWVYPLDQAKKVYLETQNTIYNCLVLKTKIRIWENVIKQIKNVNRGNVPTKIENQIEIFKKELSNRQCNQPSNKELTEKQILLQNVTYHYCNYRLYLNYLNNFSQYNVSAKSVSSQLKTPWEDKIDTNKLHANIIKQWDIIGKEAAHAKEVYNISFYAFKELENTYWTHIMLLLIYDDYAQIRSNLEKVLAPISQLAYKIPQAQRK